MCHCHEMVKRSLHYKYEREALPIRVLWFHEPEFRRAVLLISCARGEASKYANWKMRTLRAIRELYSTVEHILCT